MKLHLPRVLVIALFSALAAQTAGAAGDMNKSADAFKKLDVDNNGFISRKEGRANPDVEASFEEGDTDNDGKLSMAEFKDIELDE